MKTTKPLTAKTPLKAKKGLRAAAKSKKQPKPSTTLLRKKADKLYARAVRIRDAQYVDGGWQGKCITCPRVCLVMYVDKESKERWQKSNGWGHFVGRGDYNLRYDPENVNLQCSHCNAWRDKQDMIEAYKIALDDKYGVGTAKKLQKLAKTDSRGSLTKAEFEQVIHDAQVELDFYLNHP